jgi:hypothetical protein
MLIVSLSCLAGFVLTLTLLPTTPNTRTAQAVPQPDGETLITVQDKQMTVNEVLHQLKTSVEKIKSHHLLRTAYVNALNELKKIDSMCVDPIDYDTLSNKILEVKPSFDALYSRISEETIFGNDREIETWEYETLRNNKIALSSMMNMYFDVRKTWLEHKARIQGNDLPADFNDALTQHMQLVLRYALLQVHEGLCKDVWAKPGGAPPAH